MVEPIPVPRHVSIIGGQRRRPACGCTRAAEGQQRSNSSSFRELLGLGRCPATYATGSDGVVLSPGLARDAELLPQVLDQKLCPHAYIPDEEHGPN